MQKKSTLRKHLQMLQCFATAYARMTACGKHSLYEAHILYMDELGLFYKVFRYFVGSSVLPDEIAQNTYDVYITLLKPQDIKHYEEECRKYGIKPELSETRF